MLRAWERREEFAADGSGSENDRRSKPPRYKANLSSVGADSPLSISGVLGRSRSIPLAVDWAKMGSLKRKVVIPPMQECSAKKSRTARSRLVLSLLCEMSPGTSPNHLDLETRPSSSCLIEPPARFEFPAVLTFLPHQETSGSVIVTALSLRPMSAEHDRWHVDREKGSSSYRFSAAPYLLSVVFQPSELTPAAWRAPRPKVSKATISKCRSTSSNPGSRPF